MAEQQGEEDEEVRDVGASYSLTGCACKKEVDCPGHDATRKSQGSNRHSRSVNAAHSHRYKPQRFVACSPPCPQKSNHLFMAFCVISPCPGRLTSADMEATHVRVAAQNQ